MSRFRKKPVEVEAMRWDDSQESAYAICDWANDYGRDDWDDQQINVEYESSYGDPDDRNYCPAVLRVYTLEGEVFASGGDWIIRGVAGEFYRCRADIFAAAYELVD